MYHADLEFTDISLVLFQVLRLKAYTPILGPIFFGGWLLLGWVLLAFNSLCSLCWHETHSMLPASPSLVLALQALAIVPNLYLY